MISMIDEQRTMNNQQQAAKDGVSLMLEAKIIMAPMAGVTDMPFRMMVRAYGCRFAFTEMIDANGIVYHNRRTMHMLDRPQEDSPLGVQAAGEDAEKILHLARVCEEKGFQVLDVNAGCPARKVVKGGKGAALLKDPVKLAGIVHKLVRSVKTPITVKMRSGWDEGSMNYIDVARAVEAEGARAICVHPRTKEQMYKGMAAHDVIREVKEAVKIPVFASGNMFSPADAAGVMEKTGCDGVFVARGALGRPWIFNEMYSCFEGSGGFSEPSFEEIKDVIIKHADLCVQTYSNSRAFSRMYKHIAWYLKRHKNLNEIMKEYLKIKDLDGLRSLMARLSLREGKYLELS